MKKPLTTFQILVILITCILHGNLGAQQSTDNLFKRSNGVMQEFNTLTPDQYIIYSPENVKSLIGLDNNADLIFIRSSNDQVGMIHYRFYESFRGIPVANTMLIVHTKNNLITGFSGSFILDFGVSTNLNITPLISAEKGIQAAIDYVKAEKYAWEDPTLENKLKVESGNTNATFYPQATLSWFINDEGYDPSKMKLAYKINVYATQPLGKANYFIDAQTGVVINSQKEIFHSVVPGTAVTQYSGSRNINCESVSPGVYQLRDMSKGAGLITLNGANNLDYVNNSTNWSLSLPDQYALDVHYGISSSYDYYQSLFSRNGVDGSGLMPTCYANKSGVNETNGYAVAILSPIAMNIEFGNRTSDNLGFASIDLCGHEYTHGVVFYEGIISSTAEGEAITESLCDIMGKSIQFWAKPNDIDWRLGNDMNDIARYMSNPTLLGHPKCYQDGNWLNNGNAGQMSHTNCEVGNYMYYLLANGGTGTNCLGNSYCVSGIGLQEAEAIIYRTLTTYLTSGSVYSSWRIACIQAAVDLYGTGSNQVEQVKNAWYAVGIGTTGIVSGALAAEIISQSTFSSTEVCEDTWQYVEVAFSCSTGPYTVTICDNNGLQTVFPNAANPTPITSNTVRLFLPVNTNSHTFTLCGVSNSGGPGVITGTPSRSFNVVNCCPNLFVNGDFSSSSNYCDISPSSSQFNCSNQVVANRREVFFTSSIQSTVNFGNYLFIDGATIPMTVQCDYPNIGPPPNKNCICQTIDLVPCADYSISFFYYGDDVNTRFQIKINGQFIGSAIPMQVNPSWGIATVNYHNDLLNGPSEICISEVNTTCPSNDYVLDNIIMKRIGATCSGTACVCEPCDSSLLTDSLIINTGYDPFTMTALPFSPPGQQDAFWKITAIPFAYSPTLPAQPYVVGSFSDVPFYFSYPKSAWICPDISGSPGLNPVIPWTISYDFCICENDSVTFQFKSGKDDSLHIYLDNYSHTFLSGSVAPPVYGGQDYGTTTMYLVKGKHSLNGDLYNLAGKGGFDLAGTIKSDHLLKYGSCDTLFPVADAGTDQEICAPSTCVTLSAAPSQGIISYEWYIINGTNTFLSNGMNTTVCPTTSTCYLLVVSNIKGCKDSDTVCVNILPPTPATWSQSLPELCSGDASVLLTGGQPSGGYYQGNGVYSGNWFNAGLAGEGIQTLYYYYTDTCGNTNVVSNTISVIDCPCEPTICQGLNDNNLHEWQARPGYSQINVQLSNNLSINGSSDYYILTTDQTGASMLMADTAFQGRWCCGEFCYDYRVFDDGDSTAVLDIYPVFYIMRDTKGFKFTSSIAVNENNGWQHICAPVTNCNPAPISTLGVWEPMPGTAANDWDPVTNHIDSVFFHTEFNYGDEVNAFDNICFNSTPLSVSLINPACTDSIYALVSGCCGPYNYQWSEPSFGNSANIGGAIQYSTYTVTVTNSTGEESSATITLVTSPDCCLDTCDYFEQGPHSWMNSIPGAPVFIQTPGTSGLPSDHFLMIPNSGFSQRYLIADSAFLGKWCCGELCFDFKISNDYGLHFNPGFEISNGVLTFRFISSTNVSQASGWQHICAPISDCGFQSVSNLGSWTPVPPATANDWNTVLNHITSLKFIIPASSSYDGTVFTSFDNVCLNPSVSHVYIEPSICNDSLCIRATGCCNSFSYLWSNGSTTECIGGLIEGNVYTATVTDQNGITYTASLAAPPRLHVECFGGTANSCAGIIPTGQITATTFGGTGMKSIIVRRDGPNGPIVASSSALLNQSYIFNGLTAGHYCIFVEDANGCKDSCCCDLLPFIWLPGKTQIPPLCSNSFDGSIDVGNFTNGNFPYSYNWNNGATTAAISNLGPGFYVVTITDFNGCTIVDSTTLTAPPPITTGVITGSGALCTSTPQVLTYSIAAVPSAISYSWTVPAGATIVSGQGTTSLTISINASALNSGVKGPICVSGYDNCGLGAPSCMNLDFNVTKPVTPPSISGPSKVCPGDLVTYSISAVARASSYNWSLPSGMTITSGGGSNVIIATVLSGYTGGALSVSAVNVCGASPLRTKNLLQNIPSTPGTIIGPLNGVCGATGLMYSVPPVINATSYQWSIANGINPSALNTNSVTFDWNNSDTICNISVVALNSCGTSGTRSAIIQGKPAKPGPISGNSAVCTNGIYPYSIGTVAGSLNYNWFVPGGTSIISGQFTKTMTLGYGSIPAVSQSISVVAGNNCGTSASRQLNGISINVCPRFGEISFDQIGFTALDVYPNPAHDKLNILFTSEENSQYSLRLIDISGKIVYSETGTGDGTLKHSLWNTEQYASGLYMLQLFTEKSMSRIAVMIE